MLEKNSFFGMQNKNLYYFKRDIMDEEFFIIYEENKTSRVGRWNNYKILEVNSLVLGTIKKTNLVNY